MSKTRIFPTKVEPPKKAVATVPALQSVDISSPISAFMDLVQWTIPAGYERAYYGAVLRKLGWQYREGVYLYEVGDSATLFTAHLDTVARTPAKLALFNSNGLVSCGKGMTLGADDRAGVALILWLAHTVQLPGKYTLCTGEEVGCVGVQDFLYSPHSAPFLKDLAVCISLDRKGYSDIITHQMRGQLASDMFAEILADELRAQGLYYTPCSAGLLTDSLYLADIIPQIVNLSVGYHGAHSPNEFQDTVFLNRLGNALANLDYYGLEQVAAAYPLNPPLLDPDFQDYTQDAFTWIDENNRSK